MFKAFNESIGDVSGQSLFYHFHAAKYCTKINNAYPFFLFLTSLTVFNK